MIDQVINFTFFAFHSLEHLLVFLGLILVLPHKMEEKKKKNNDKMETLLEGATPMQNVRQGTVDTLFWGFLVFWNIFFKINHRILWFIECSIIDKPDPELRSSISLAKPAYDLKYKQGLYYEENEKVEFLIENESAYEVKDHEMMHLLC